MHSIENEELSGKVILEVGSGRGDTPRKFVDLLNGKSNAQLIITDISDRFFQQLHDEFQDREVQTIFVQEPMNYGKSQMLQLISLAAITLFAPSIHKQAWHP